MELYNSIFTTCIIRLEVGTPINITSRDQNSFVFRVVFGGNNVCFKYLYLIARKMTFFSQRQAAKLLIHGS